MKRTRRGAVIVILLTLLAVICGCAKDNDETKEEPIRIPETTVSMQDITEKGTESVESISGNRNNLEGMYILEEAKHMDGIFLAYEDGSFDRYVTGGYCKGLTKSSTEFDGYYALNSMLLDVPAVITETDQLAVFSDRNFNITLHPINFEVGAISVESDNGVRGFGHCSYLFEDNMNVSVHYSNHDTEVMDVLYIDSILPSEYPLEITEKIVHPYKGMKSKEEVARYYSFPRGDKVSLATAQGTALIEKTYDVNATYYDLYVNHNEWDVVDYYILDYKPTVEGYAKIEMHDSWQGVDIPAGKYIMVYKTDRTYKASVINWEGK